MKLVKGCNYHTTWQANNAMRFVLIDYNSTSAILATTKTRKLFTTQLADLIFIASDSNVSKAKRINNGHWNTIQDAYNRCGLQPEDYGFTKEIK